MLGETSSISLKNGKGFYEDNENGQKDLSIDVRYENGTTWVPVRKLAETFGFTVGYKEGYVLVGDRLRIDKVFNDNSLFRQLKDEFNTYKVPGKKAEGKTYHVAQTAIASDANSGTEEYPFLTIQKAADVAKAGDTVIVHEGTYRETVKPKNNGSAMAPIVFRAAEGEKVVISALEKLSKFIDYRGDIVCATAPIDLGFGRNQVFYKGEQLIEGRHPNEHTKPGESEYPPEVPKGLYATKGNIRITEYRGTKAYSSTDLEQDEVDYWKGGTYVTLKGYGWSLVSGEIVGSAKGELTLTDHEGTVSYNLGILPSVYHGTHYYYEHALESDYAYITNHINTLDLPGEWFMKDNIMYMIPPKDADLKNDFEIKQRQLCIDLREKMYITFDGIDTIGGSMTADNATGCTLLNGEFKNVAHHTVLLDQNGYTMSADEDPYSYDSQKNGEAGFYFSGQYNALVNCVIDRSSATGIQLRDRYQYVNNCIIKNCSYSGGYPGNICVSGDKEMWAAGEFAGGHFVTYNTLYNAGRGVYNAGTAGTKADGTYYGSAPCEMAYNRCFNGALNTRDTGVTYEYGYTGGNDVAKTAMHHNYVYDAGHWDKDEGSKLMLLYQDGFTASRDTYSNVTWYDDATKPVTPKHGIFVQNAQWSILRSRNNAELGYLPNGEDMIERSDYPGGRTFTTGADFGEYIHRNMANYEAHDKGVLYDKPVDIKVNKETGAEVFSFKDVDFKDGGVILNYYMERKVGAPGSFNVTARVYNKDGKLVYEGAN
ncbi:MAG: DUF1565 domain-containing protein, partial [Ruminococcus sp.]|nr:DUF1565 domain-containing protein [Ruminococcus sp.]